MDYSDEVAKAVSYFWRARTKQFKAQGSVSGGKDAGNRAAVTAGKPLDGFIHLFKKILADAGLPDSAIQSRQTTLPGYFRPTKN